MVLVAFAWLFGAAAGLLAPDPSAGAAKSMVEGRSLTRLGGTDVSIVSAGARMRLTCRGTCDDVVVEPALSWPKVRVLNASGECVLCRSEARWRVSPGGVSVLAIRPEARRQ